MKFNYPTFYSKMIVIVFLFFLTESMNSPSKLHTCSTLLKFDSFLLDCDGVLWEGERLIPGARDAVNLLRKGLRKNVFLVTNTSKMSRFQLRDKAIRLKLVDDVGLLFRPASNTYHPTFFPA